MPQLKENKIQRSKIKDILGFKIWTEHWSSILPCGFSGKRREENWAEVIHTLIIAEIFPELMKDANIKLK